MPHRLLLAVPHQAEQPAAVRTESRLLGAGLIPLGTAVTAVAVLGPLVSGVLRYRTSPTSLNQIIGGDAAALAALAPRRTAREVEERVLHGHAASPWRRAGLRGLLPSVRPSHSSSRTGAADLSATLQVRCSGYRNSDSCARVSTPELSRAAGCTTASSPNSWTRTARQQPRGVSPLEQA